MSKKEVHKFFNFPIQLLEGFLKKNDSYFEILDNVSQYAVYTYSKNFRMKGGGDYDSSIEAFEKGAEYFNINFNDVEKAHETGVSLYEKYELLPTPMTGINVKTFWEFRKSEKTINEKRVLLANLAIKSILQEQSFCKITFDFMLSRMDGMSKKFKDTGELSDEIRILRDRRKLRGLKRELKRSWGFTTFDGRGTYWSSKMSIDDLTYHVMKNSKVQKDKKIKKLEYEAIEKAKLRLL